EMGEWAAKQKKLYQDYYDELRKVRSVISGAAEVKQIFAKQSEIVNEYKKTFLTLQQSPHFKFHELDSIRKVYTGIITRSENVLSILKSVTRVGSSEMRDSERLSLIAQCFQKMNDCLDEVMTVNEAVMPVMEQREKAS